MSLVLRVNIRIKPENVDAFMRMVIENGKAGEAFKKYLANAVPLLASRERQFWKKAL